MKDLYEMVCDAVNQCEDIGIEVGIISEITVNSRAKRRWGRCYRLRDKTYRIEINSRLLEDDVSDKTTMNTVVHEVLHTCIGCMNHGLLWKSYADRMNKTYGYEINRCTSAKEVGVEEEYKHTVVCTDCGHEYHAHRLTKAFKYIRDYPESTFCRCAYCHSYNLVYITQGGENNAQKNK